eukprot:gene5412-5953_t
MVCGTGHKEVVVSSTAGARLQRKLTANEGSNSSVAIETISLPKLLVVSLVKEEDDILDYWIDYHATLFGTKSILLLDNFSKSLVTKKILHKWQGLGVTVLYKQGPYHTKGKVWLAAAKTVRPHADIYIPLDIDEVLISYNNSVPIIDSIRLFNEIRRFAQVKNSSILNLSNFDRSCHLTVNDTVNTINQFVHQFCPITVCKKIFKVKTLISVDQGNHKGKVTSGGIMDTDSIGLLHFHHRGALLLYTRALDVVIAHGYLPPTTTLDNLAKYASSMEQRIQKKTDLGLHKLQELLDYIRFKGNLTAILQKQQPNHADYTFLTLPQIVEKVHEEMKYIKVIYGNRVF